MKHVGILLGLLLFATLQLCAQGAPVDYLGFPKDLSNTAMAIRQATDTQYYSYAEINKSIKKRFKKYPFKYSLIGPTQYATPQEMLDAGFKYEFVYKKVALNHHRQGSEGVRTTNMTEKNLFWVMVRDLTTGKTYSPQRSPIEYPFAFRDFVKAVNKSFKP